MNASRVEDRGAGTVLVAAMAGLLLVLGCAVGVVGALVVDHRRAQAAADLAALAGAAAFGRGEDPCTAAGTVATADGSRLESCRVEDADVVVGVVVTGPRWLGQRSDLHAEARAGPGPSDASVGSNA